METTIPLAKNLYDVVRKSAFRLLTIAMNLSDALLVLLLTAQIHGTDDAVRASARKVVKKLPRSKRTLIYSVINSKTPMEYVRLVALHLDD